MYIFKERDIYNCSWDKLSDLEQLQIIAKAEKKDKKALDALKRMGAHSSRALYILYEIKECGRSYTRPGFSNAFK